MWKMPENAADRAKKQSVATIAQPKHMNAGQPHRLVHPRRWASHHFERENVLLSTPKIRKSGDFRDKGAFFAFLGDVLRTLRWAFFYFNGTGAEMLPTKNPYDTISAASFGSKSLLVMQ